MQKKRLGFTLIDLLLFLSILAILASMALPSLFEYYRTYKFNYLVSEIESVIRQARFKAQVGGTGVSICIKNNTLQIFTLKNNPFSACSGSLIKEIKVDDPSFVLEANHEGTVFDPKGIALYPVSITFKSTKKPSQCVIFNVASLSGYVEKKQCVKET
ncbi:MAG: hypothetical protein QW472_01750 [Candidatus Aenigmatarchaeota archaeon]